MASAQQHVLSELNCPGEKKVAASWGEGTNKGAKVDHPIIVQVHSPERKKENIYSRCPNLSRPCPTESKSRYSIQGVKNASRKHMVQNKKVFVEPKAA